MKKHFAIGLWLLITAANLHAQTDDKTQIETLITDLYFEGWMTGDTAKIGKAMHLLAEVFNPVVQHLCRADEYFGANSAGRSVQVFAKYLPFSIYAPCCRAS